LRNLLKLRRNTYDKLNKAAITCFEEKTKSLDVKIEQGLMG